MNTQITNRIKSLIWRTSGMAFVAIAGYLLQIGDIWQVDPKALISFSILTFIGLIAGEITKFFNTAN